MKQDVNHLRLLYHYTSEAGLEAILKDSVLLVSRGPRGRELAAGPLRVVWLTDATDPGTGADHGLAARDPQDPRQDKRGVRITVSVDYAQHWPEWAKRRRVSRRLRRAIDDFGAGLSETWWVAPHAVPSRDWVHIEDLRSGEVIWSRRLGAATSTHP